MSTKNNGLSVVINNNGHVSFNADLEFLVEEKEKNSVVHLSDLIQGVVLDAIKKQVEEAYFAAGDYRVVLTGCVSNITNVKDKERADVATNVEETDEEEKNNEEVPEEDQKEDASDESAEAENSQ